MKHYKFEIDYNETLRNRDDKNETLRNWDWLK
jgi:hypothetical protein